MSADAKAEAAAAIVCITLMLLIAALGTCIVNPHTPTVHAAACDAQVCR